MKHFKKKHPSIKCGLLIGIKKNLDKINHLDFNAINWRHTSKKTTKETFIWTVNNMEEFKKIKKGQNIITDKPNFISNLI